MTTPDDAFHSPAPADPKQATEPAAAWRLTRGEVLRDSAGVGIASGAYAISFGALALAGGLNFWQTMTLSLLMFTGGSQFGLIGVVASGGAPLAGAATAIMLGARNALYGLRLSELLNVRGARRVLAAQLVLDESTAMSIGRDTERAARWGFYATGISVFVCWNTGTAVGLLGASWLSEPRLLGLDAAAPAAFLALLAPRLRGREAWAVALAAALVALITVPFVPIGIPVLIAALVGVLVGLWPRPGVDDIARERSVDGADETAGEGAP